jgi:hypothetical protein
MCIYIYIIFIYTYYYKDLTASNLSWPELLACPGPIRAYHQSRPEPLPSSSRISVPPLRVGGTRRKWPRDIPWHHLWSRRFGHLQGAETCDDFLKNDLRWSEYMSKTKVRTSSKHLKIIQTTCQGKESNSFFIVVVDPNTTHHNPAPT